MATWDGLTAAILDDFDRANGGLGANWSTLTGLQGPVIVSTAARRGSDESGAKWTAGSPISPSMWGRLRFDTLDAAASDNEVGLNLRMPDTGTADVEFIFIRTETVCEIASYTGSGSYTALSTLSQSDVNGAHEIIGFARGPLLEMWYDGVRIAAARSTTLTTGGRAGIYIEASAADDNEIETFEFGPTTEVDAYIDSDYLGVAGSAANVTSASSVVITLEHAIAAGELIVISIGCDNNGTNGVSSLTGVTDSDGNTYTLVQDTVDPGAAAAGATAGIAYCICTTPMSAGSSTITVNFSPNTAAKAVKAEHWANIDPTTPVAVAVTSATGTSTSPSVSRTPTAADQLFVGLVAVEGPSNDSYTEDADTTDGEWRPLPCVATSTGTSTSNITISSACKRVTGTSAQTWGPTLGTSRDWVALGIVFARAAGGGADVDGVLAQALGGSLTATGQRTVRGVAAQALGGTLAITGTRGVDGVLAQALGGTLTAEGTTVQTVTGTLSQGFGGTLAATGQREVTGSVAQSLGGSLDLTGQREVDGALTQSLGGTLSADGQRSVDGQLAQGLGGTLSVDGDVGHDGALSQSLGGTLAATGQRTTHGTLAQSFGGTLELDGGGVANIDGALAQSFGGALAVAGQRSVKGAISQSFGGTLVLTGGAGASGTLSQGLGGQLTLTGQREVTGELAQGLGGVLAVAGARTVAGALTGSLGGTLTITAGNIVVPQPPVLAIAGSHTPVLLIPASHVATIDVLGAYTTEVTIP